MNLSIIIRISAFLRVLTTVCFVASLFVVLLLTGCDSSTQYRRYAHNSHVRASFSPDYVIVNAENDSVSMDVTLLQAVDSIGWKTLIGDFGLNEPTDDLARIIADGADIVGSKSLNSDRKDANDILAVSYKRHIVSVFHACSKKDELAVLNHNTINTSRLKDDGIAFNIINFHNNETGATSRTIVDNDCWNGLMAYFDSIYRDTTLDIRIDDNTLHLDKGSIHFFTDGEEDALQWCRRMYLCGYTVYIAPEANSAKYHCVAKYL